MSRGERGRDVLVTGAVALLAAVLGAAGHLGGTPAGELLLGGLALAGSAVAGHLFLRGLGVPRTAAIALPVLFTLFGAAPAEMLCVLALWADLSAARGRFRRRWLWRLVSVPAALVASLSTLAVLPLLLVGELAIWAYLRHREPPVPVPVPAPARARLGAALSAVAGVAGGLRVTAEAFQRATTPAATPVHPLQAIVDGLLSSLSPAAAAMQQSLAWWPASAAAIAAGLALGWYLWRVADPRRSDVGRRRWWLGLTLAGIAVVAGGDGVALAAPAQPAGLGAGMAMSVLGAAGIVSGLAPTALLRRELLAVTYAGEQALAAQIVRELPDPPARSVILVEAACSSPAPGWPDVGRLVAAAYGDPSLQAAVLTGMPTAGRDGLSASVGGGATTRYAYGDLFIYNEARRRVYRISDSQTASRYVVDDQATTGCDR